MGQKMHTAMASNMYAQTVIMNGHALKSIPQKMIVPMKTSEKTRKFLLELFTEDEQKPSSLRFGKKIRSFFVCLMTFVVIFDIVMLLYINVGHERGWPRAERWYHALYDVKH